MGLCLNLSVLKFPLLCFVLRTNGQLHPRFIHYALQPTVTFALCASVLFHQRTSINLCGFSKQYNTLIIVIWNTWGLGELLSY